MAYTASNHQAFSQRMQNFFKRLQALRNEAVEIEAIYTNEAESGAAPAWEDTDVATADEHAQGIVYMEAFDSLNETHTQRITPFIQE